MTINIAINNGVVCWIFDAHNPAKMGACRITNKHTLQLTYNYIQLTYKLLQGWNPSHPYSQKASQ